ncbi:ATP-binding protein [Vibrio lentus]|uniref:ATP-binding protein n=1 Tax=Vibrio lentus TaxID=136468 RepID=UPI001E298C4E|nr:ATP-binding protein [Vibrio lentus]MCC4783103.1 ATP-binding protein [Vibrio lentus]
MAQMNVSARAVDMLGRQQIAGIPTAIHELFKNAHDAYANNAEIDYFQDQNLVTLRDDGIGMTQEDFEKKWLTIGTSSKFGVNRKSAYIPEGMDERPLMGEKGIGRLAIASIGRQVVALSRAERADGMHDMVVALIHWSQFEIPDLGVSDIVIPTRTFPESKLPTAEDLQSMAQELVSHLTSLGNAIPLDYFELIKADTKLLSFSPEVLFTNLQNKTQEDWVKIPEDLKTSDTAPKLDGIGKGTHFIIMPCDETLALDVEVNEKGTTDLQKILVGFSNTFGSVTKGRLKTKFRLYQGAAEADELIEEGFFTAKDAADGDHIVEGEFDAYGQFKGKVTVYKGEPQEHIINWNEGYGSKTRCGPFKIKFTYLQGTPSESMVPSERYVELQNKLAMYGGLYIYRDGVRVLPYGKQEFDFLKFEEKRTRNAGTAFFSHRLMFGAISIEHDVNTALEEKAGREGLRENLAYKEFKKILEHFFEQLAADFFRDNSSNDRFSEIKTKFKEIVKQAGIAEKKRKKLVSAKKEAVRQQLHNFFDCYSDGTYLEQVESLKSQVKVEFEKTNEAWNDQEKYHFISNLRRDITSAWKEIDKDIKITKPKVGLSKPDEKNWISYLTTREKLVEDVINPAKKEIESKISEYVSSNSLSFSLRDRVSEFIEEEKKTLTKTISSYRDELKSNVGEIDSVIKEKARSKSAEYTRSLAEVMSEINSTAIDTLSEEESLNVISSWEKQLEEINEQTEQYFQKMRDTVEVVINDISNDESSSSDVIVALESENEQVKESLNQYYEFAQLGMSLGIIQHEFSSTARNVRNSIRSLKPWADTNPELGGLYNNISHSFAHLDGYLKMFTPLNRRLYRSKVELSGKEIEAYLRDIFDERLKRHNITFTSTREFLVRTTNVFPSSFLPVFINVVDNAIYWLNTQLESENDSKEIKLDVDGDYLLISNNGPTIPLIDRNRIFEFTFSRKANGRGMGLFISKESLNHEGFDIQLASGGADASPCFVISEEIMEQE